MNSIIFCLVVICVIGCNALTPTYLIAGTSAILFSNYTNKFVTVDPTTLALNANGTTDPSLAAIFTGANDGDDGAYVIYNENGYYVTIGSTSLTASVHGHPGHPEDVSLLQRAPYTTVEASNGNLWTVQPGGTLFPTTSTIGGGNNFAPLNASFLAFSPVAKTPVNVTTLAAGQRVIIYSVSRSAYITVAYTGGSPTYQLGTGATDPTQAAIFNVTIPSAGTYALAFTIPFGYISVAVDTTTPIKTNDNLGPDETLTITAVSGTNYFTIKGGNGNPNYVTAATGGSTLLSTSNVVAANTEFFFQTAAL